MWLRRCMQGSLVFAVIGCGSTQQEPPEKSPAQVQAEQLARSQGFDLREVALMPAQEGAGERHELHFQGVPIWGLEAKTVGGVTRLTGVHFAPAERAETKPGVSQAQAEAAALAQLKAPSASVEGTRLMFLPREERRLRPDAPPAEKPNAEHYERVVTGLTLIYRVMLISGEERWVAQVDARSGRVLRVDPLAVDLQIRGAYRNATGYGHYSGTQTLTVYYDQLNALYTLADRRGNAYFPVHYREGVPSTDDPYTSTDASFGDGRLFGQKTESDSVNGETAAVDAYHAVNMTWTFFEHILGRNGPTGGRPVMVRLHFQKENAWYDPHLSRPTVTIGYDVFPTRATLLIPMATTDIVAHELSHDFFMREVAGDPTTFPLGRSELRGMNEGAADIFAFMTELTRDALRAGRPLSALDAQPLRPSNLTMGEEMGLFSRSLLEPTYEEWFDGIGGEEEHRAGGPLGRMFMLLAYGCSPVVDPNTLGPWDCSLVPEGFTGLGPTLASRIWANAVVLLPMGADYLQARQAALDAAATTAVGDDGHVLRTVALAFAAINVGSRPDTHPPRTTLSCQQVGPDLECTGTVSDAEDPGTFLRAPQLVVDGGAQVITLPGWQFTQRIPGATLSHGNHTVQLKAWDVWLNEATQTVTAFVDHAGPQASVTRSGPPKKPLLTVTATDPSSVAMVEFHEGTQLLDTLFTPPYDKAFDTSAWTDGTHNLVIKVYDGFFNVTVLNHALKADNTPPAVTMTVGTGDPPFSITAAVSDASTLTRVDFKVDPLVFATHTHSATSYQAVYTPTDGLAHNLTVEVTDSFGNKGVAAQAAPRDLKAPTVTFSSSQLAEAVRLNVGVSDTCGIEYPYGLYVDGILVGTATTPLYVLDFGAALAAGPHAFHAIVRDRCGNTANFQTVFTKYYTPPVITGIVRDDTQPKKPKFTVQCTDTEGVHHVELRENGVVVQSDSTAPYEFVVDTTPRTDGNYSLLFHCTDIYGVSSTPVTRTVTADNTGPSIEGITVFGSGRSYFVSPGTVSDPRGVQSVKILGGTIPNFSVTQTVAPYGYTWVIPGTVPIQFEMPFTIVAKDKWGNESSLVDWCDVDTNSTQNAYLVCH